MKPSEYIQKGWCQNVAAKRSDNTVCPPYDPMAAKWCMMGAVRAAYPNDMLLRSRLNDKLIRTLTDKLGHYINTTDWNDNPKRIQAEVVELLISIGE